MQVLEIITDACLVEPNIGIGACICRIAKKDVKQKTQIIKSIWLFNATASFEAEIMTGIKAITKSKEITLSDKIEILWSCDLSYLDELLKNSSSAQNSRMKELLEEVRILTKDDILEVSYPRQPSIVRYHNGCHRICSALRKGILENPLNLTTSYQISKKVLEKYTNWNFLGCDVSKDSQAST